MHDLDIVHGNVRTVSPPIPHPRVTRFTFALCQTNVLVDKDGTPQISGFGNASILPRSTRGTIGGGASTDQFFRNRAPEMTRPGVSLDGADPMHPTKACDMYAFGVMTWEVWTDTLFDVVLFAQLETGPHGTATVLRDDGDCNSVFDAKWD